ncbi:MAG: signal peptidase I [Actinomycetota bacterium]|nr:signal peptidase I [Actinomycetota bacterium]
MTVDPAYPRVHTGNAGADGAARRGWLVGHFLPPEDLRRSDDVEIKWGVHRAGDERVGRQGAEHRTTVVLLVAGRFELHLDTGSVVLERQGDYAMWGPGIAHSWRAEEDSVVLTIRWPSTR